MEQGDLLVEQLVLTTHLTQKMPSNTKTRLNCSRKRLQKGNSSGLERVVIVA